MPTFDFTSPDGKTYSVNGPDGATPEQAFAMLNQHLGAPNESSVAGDVAKSAGIGLARGPINALGSIGDLSEYGARGLDVATRYVGNKLGYDIPERPNQEPFGGSAQIQRGVESATGPFYQPQTTAGKYAQSAGEMVGNPLSYVGPGSLGLKVGGAALAGLGSEAGGQAAEGTALETPARLAGGLAGGIAAGKALAPSAPRAAVPTLAELKAQEDKLYAAARNSGVEVSPKQLANQATQWEQELTTGPKYAFTGGPEGTAPKTLKILEKLQSPPGGASITASNLDTLRRQINAIAGETKDFKPTPDAKAAMVLKRSFADYLENPPQGHIVAGNAEDFVRNLKEANATHSSLAKLRQIDTKTGAAENVANRQIAGSLDNQIKAKIGGIADRPKSLRGYTKAEQDQIKLINDGSLMSNVLRQLGRGGTGVIPLGAHAATAAATGGASIPASLAIGLPLYAAKKGAEAMTVSRAKALAEMIAKNSPLYRKRAAALPQVDVSPNVAAVVRGLLGGL